MKFEDDFLGRIASNLQGKVDIDITKVRDNYSGKIKSLQNKIHRMQGKTDVQKSQVWQRKLDTFISVGTTLLGAFMGKGRRLP